MMTELLSIRVAGDEPALRLALAAASLPTEDLLDDGRVFYRFEASSTIVGYAGLELYGEDVLLRSVVVLPDARGHGFGRSVAEGTLGRARESGARRAFLLTSGAADFFTRLGFAPVARAEAPASILGTRQAKTICSSALLMARPLTIDRG